MMKKFNQSATNSATALSIRTIHIARATPMRSVCFDLRQHRAYHGTRRRRVVASGGRRRQQAAG